MEIYQVVKRKDVVSCENIRDHIAKDPFFFFRHFQQRFRSMLILKKDGPLGNVIHFFYRVEYQQRGAEHVHAFFWDKEAPKEDASDGEKLAYITKYVTCRMPDEKTEPELHKVIRGSGMHWRRHSKTCMRRMRIGNKIIWPERRVTNA